MIYKGYVIYPVYDHYRVVSPKGQLVADVDSYTEGKAEIDEIEKEN